MKSVRNCLQVSKTAAFVCKTHPNKEYFECLSNDNSDLLKSKYWQLIYL